MKLFAIRIVARSFSGVSNNFNTSLLFLLSFFCKLFFWVGDNEKKATSEPETSADENNKIKIPISPKIVPTENWLKLMLKVIKFNSGSGSKIY